MPMSAAPVNIILLWGHGVHRLCAIIWPRKALHPKMQCQRPRNSRPSCLRKRPGRGKIPHAILFPKTSRERIRKCHIDDARKNYPVNMRFASSCKTSRLFCITGMFLAEKETTHVRHDVGRLSPKKFWESVAATTASLSLSIPFSDSWEEYEKRNEKLVAIIF